MTTLDLGNIYEVDILYQNKFHDLYNDLAILPENIIPHDSKIPKLIIIPNIKYIIHYSYLQQAMTNVLIVIKVHRVLEFQHSAWLAKFLQLNNEMKKKAVKEFKKDIFKILNYVVFIKTTMSMRKGFKMDFISKKILPKLINNHTVICNYHT